MSASTEIVTILEGNKYSWTYAERLADAVHRHSSRRLVIYTDQERRAEHADVRMLPPGVPVHGWWWKLSLFRLGLGNLLWLDLDTAILGNLDTLIERAEAARRFVTLENIYQPRDFGSGVMWIPAEMGPAIWDRFVKAGHPQRSIFGDQLWIQDCYEDGSETHPHAFWDDVAPGAMLSFKGQVQAGTPWHAATIVYFHGRPRPHQLPTDDPMRRIWEGQATDTRTAT